MELMIEGSPICGFNWVHPTRFPSKQVNDFSAHNQNSTDIVNLTSNMYKYQLSTSSNCCFKSFCSSSNSAAKVTINGMWHSSGIYSSGKYILFYMCMLYIPAKS